MKKFLSIILSILMVVTMLPFTPLAGAADTVTVYLKNTAGWSSTVYAYCWKDNGSVRPLGSWPGTLMDEVEGESQLYAIDVPSDIYGIIFNDGSNQTDDLFLPADGSNYYNNGTGEWTTISTQGHDHALTAGGEALEFATLSAGVTKIEAAGNYYLTQDIELTENLWIEVEGTVNLCLNGHSITAVEEDDDNPEVVIIKAGTLNLCDCQGGGCITSAEDLKLSGVSTLADTEFNMYSGEIKNNYYYAVDCIDFNMYGGKLSGNKLAAVDVKGAFNMYGGEISGNISEYGAVYVEPGGSFTMHDGEIKNNTVTDPSTGTVYVNESAFTMKGGKITGNTSSDGYGGVWTSGTFVMEGGEISGNSSYYGGGAAVIAGGSFIMNGGVIKNNTAVAYGGGVGVDGSASFTMNGGEISGNTAEQGGGVFATYDSAKINLKKGVITGNSATYAGGVGGQYAHARVEFSGADVQIINNTAPNYPDLRANAPVIVSAPLDSAKTKISLSVNGYTIAQPYGTNLTTLEGMEDCFIVLEEDCFIKCNEKGELELTEWNASISEKDGDLVVEAPHNGAYTITYQWYEVNGDELTELEGETSDKLTADKVVVGKTYACKIYLDGEEKEMLTIDSSYKITHQPTAAEPYVELNDDTDASFRWYAVEVDAEEITDENADTVSYSHGESYYNKETGWTGVSYEEDGIEYDFFTVELKEGETVIVEITGDVGYGIGLWDYDAEIDVWKDFEEGVTTYELTAPSAGNYTLYTYVYSYEVTVKAHKAAVYSKIEGETTAELKNAEIGKKYTCEVTFADDTTEMSDVLEYKYAITHQPTEEEPYVETNDNKATYQWYAVEVGAEEITDENAVVFNPDFIGEPANIFATQASYNASTGWSPAITGYGEGMAQYYFVVEMKADEKINFELSSAPQQVLFVNLVTNSMGTLAPDGDKISATATEDGIYYFAVLGTSVITVKASKDDASYTEVAGNTAAKLTPSALGKYACEVTFADGTTEMSDTFEVTTLHTCDFTGEWKYDADKHWKECDCGLISEEGTHTGGEATCTTLAVCDTCGESYGELDPNNHEYENNNGFCCETYQPAELNENGYYAISNAGQLYWFAAQVDAGKKAISGKLMADIVVNEGTVTASSTGLRAWNPIGNVSNQYTGSFDGGEHTISGLYFNDSSVKYVGLFSWVGKGGTVQNVGVINSYISGNNRIGGVAGQNEGTIKGCYNTGIVSIVSDGSGSDDSLYGYYTGGVVGHNLYGTVEDCYNTGRINTGFYTTGGVVGYNEYGTVAHCYNTGTVSGISYVGGVVGYNLYGTVDNCYNTGTVTGSDQGVGGVVSYNEGGITNCYNTGTVSGSLYVGGVAGYNKDGTVDNCYNTGIVNGSSIYIGGVVAQNLYGTVEDCYNTGAVSGTGYVGGVVGYLGDGTVTSCYNTGAVNGGDRTGGVVGYLYDSTVTGCYNTGTVSGSRYVGGVAGYNNATVTGCYFDSTVYTGNAIGGGSGTATDVEGKSTAQFASGEVAYLLSQGENGSIWGQDLDNGKPVQTTPTFNGAKVYYGYTSCGDTVAKYTNDETISAEKPDHTQKPTCTDNGDGTHSFTCGDCGATVSDNHSGGTATCTEQAKCEHCGASYGELDPNNHEYENNNGFCCETYQPAVLNGDVYEISNAGQLYWFAQQVNSGSTAINGELTADIVVNENVLTADGSLNGDGSNFRAWTPIGTEDNAYTGEFRGGGHTVSGLYFNDSTVYHVGLFGYVGSGGTVQNVGVIDSYFYGYSYVGGVAGCNRGTLQYVYNTGNVNGKRYAGGVTGENKYIVQYAYNTGTVFAMDYAGGVTGYNKYIVQYAYNTGSAGGAAYYGGIAGDNRHTLKDCYYLADSETDSFDGTTAKTAGQFEIGEVAYLLGSPFGQNIGTHVSPVLNLGYEVYQVQNCKNEVVYSNTNENLGHQYENGVCTICGAACPGHSYENGTCTVCGAACPGHSYENGICTVCGAACPGHSYENGVCTVCGAACPGHSYENGFCPYGCYEPAVLNNDGVYEISNAGQLYWFAAQVDAGKKAISGKLMADIVVNEGTVTASSTGLRVWNPIGYYNSESDYITIKGTFDGNNKTVSGLYFNSRTAMGVGLFSCVDSGSIVKNVGVINSYIKGRLYVGGVAGYVLSNGTVENCYNAGTVNGNYIDFGGVIGSNYGTVENCYNTGTVGGREGVGGVIGKNFGTVKNCYNTGTVNGSSDYVGGVVGYNYEKGIIQNCYNTGTVSGGERVGGVIGESDGTVENSYNTGIVSGNTLVGGVLGFNYSNFVQNCYNTGNISGSGDDVGGVVGWNYDGTVQNCYNTGTVSGVSSVGGVIAGTYKGRNINCYNIGTVSGESYVGGVMGNRYTSAGTATNCYYLTGCAKDGNNTVQYGIGNETIGSTTADSEGSTIGKTAEQFKSGEVAYLLNGSTSEGDLVWGQLIGTDSYPVFGGETVYYNESKGYYNLHTCDFSGEWKYDADKHWKECTADGCDKISEEAEHSYTDGKCACGYECAHTWDEDGYCRKCKTFCKHENNVNGVCTVCDYVLTFSVITGDTVSYYDSFDDALENAEEGSTVKLMKGIEQIASYEINKAITFDLNGNNWDTGSSDYIDVYSFVTFTDSVGTGNLNLSLNLYAPCLFNSGTYKGIDIMFETEDTLDDYLAECHGFFDHYTGEFKDVSDEKYVMGAKVDVYHKLGAQTCKGYQCEECGEYFGEADPDAHDWSNKDGICVICGEECPHEWGEGVLTRPVYDAVLGSKDGYYTYTCIVCAKEKKETVKSADYSAYEAVSVEINTLLQSDELTFEAKQEIYSAAIGHGLPSNDLMESEQNIVDDLVAELEKIVADADEKIASGEYVKADYTEIDEAIKAVEDKLTDENITDEGKAGLEEIKKQLEEMKADENTSAADVAELEKALEDYEEELDKGIKDGTLVMVDGDKIAVESNKKFAEKLEAEGLTDEYEDFIYNQKATDEALAAEKEINDFANSLEGTVAENAENIAKLNEMLDSLYSSFENCLRGTHNFKDYEITSPAKCEVNAIETGTCWFCGETDEREVEGTALSHSFTKYEETEAPKCGVAGKEVAYCDHGCGETDERETPALEHIFLDYTSNGDATCTADGTKTAVCNNGCGKEDTVLDEGSMLDHVDEDGDKICDDCESEIENCACGKDHKTIGDVLYCFVLSVLQIIFTFLMKKV